MPMSCDEIEEIPDDQGGLRITRLPAEPRTVDPDRGQPCGGRAADVAAEAVTPEHDLGPGRGGGGGALAEQLARRLDARAVRGKDGGPEVMQYAGPLKLLEPQSL